ncbi:MAG TPA: protein translocase subunit SecD [Acidimicrobiales bacterium]|nr:protein translocase subunit SecD [Acidimicrobiales bacterium]
MRRRSHWVPLIVTLVLAIGSMAAVLLAGYRPVLGLDLRGGVSVALKPAHPVSKDILNQAKNIITNRVDALGVAEPNITLQGSDIVVQLPGVKDSQRALALIGQTAQLTFRPVLQSSSGTQEITAPTNGKCATPTGLPPTDGIFPLATANNPTQCYIVGPVLLNGTIIHSATAGLSTTGQWLVNFTTTSAGSGAFDAMAAKEYHQYVAIVLDNVVESAPQINATAFHGSGQISGSFTETQAKDLALVLSYGSLPVKLVQQSVQTVSATLGSSSLRAGLIAGVGGLILVLLYIILYYRALGLVAFFGLALTGAFIWPVISYMGHTANFALTLAGVTGVIVSIGINVDSYIVYFERLKDEIRSGKTVRSSVDRGFRRAFRTIVVADAVSFIGAVLLYLLSVGPVRGFAFMLGLSTLIDVFTSYFFTRPLVILMGRNPTFTEARFMGVGRGLAAPGVAP